MKWLLPLLLRPGYESVQAPHRNSPILPSSSSSSPHTPHTVRAGGRSHSGLNGTRVSSTHGTPTAEQLISPPSSSSSPPSTPSQPQPGSTGEAGMPTVVISRVPRPLTRQQLYMSRNALHHELQLPDGYGELSGLRVSCESWLWWVVKGGGEGWGL